MTDQAWSMLVGFGIVVGMRLLDWAFPKGAVWRKVRDWSMSGKEFHGPTRDRADEGDEGR